MKLLIAAPESLGEIVCSTALLRCLKNQMAEADVHYWVEPQWAPAVMHHPSIDSLYSLEDDPALLPEALFDVLIDLKPSRHLRQWARVMGMRYLSISVSFLVSYLSEHFGLYGSSSQHHIVNRFFDAVKPLGVYNDGLGPAYHLGVADEVKPSDIPAAQSAGYIALVAGEQDYDRPIPPVLLEAFCKRINYPLVLVSSRGNTSLARQLTGIDPVKIYNACGKFTLNETADLLRRSRLVLTSETGLMQVGAAFGKPMLVWRSAAQPTPFYPPLYNKKAHNPLQEAACMGWVWPSGGLRSWRTITQDKLGAAAEQWVQQGLRLVGELLQPKG